LELDGKALRKMRYVFDFFRDRNDVVLLWCPRALVKATLKFRRPYLFMEYQDMEDEFVK